MYLQQLVQQSYTSSSAPQYVMHCDDDSFLRIDLLVSEVSRESLFSILCTPQAFNQTHNGTSTPDMRLKKPEKTLISSH